MLVRDLRIRPRGPILGAALTVFALAAARPHSLPAQEPAATVPASHTVKRGDTLWDLAKRYLGDAFQWPEIYWLNTDIIQDPHWIYPGEVLHLAPVAKVVAVDSPTASAPVPVPVSVPSDSIQTAAGPADTATAAKPQAMAGTPGVLSTPTVIDSPRAEPAAAPAREATPPIVRAGEYAASPWVDQQGGPKGSGYIMQARDLPGIRSKDQSRMNLFDRVVVVPPASGAPEHSRFLAYRLGPMIEDFGQIVIPTGVIEIVRAPRAGEAAVGRVVKMFGEVLQSQRLIPYDTSAAVVRGAPLPISDGHAGRVRWIYNEPVLPSLQSYVVVDIARGDGVTAGDQIDLYQPRHASTDSSGLAIPELYIARAQVLRVTPYGATAIITGQEQPSIRAGTAARVAAKMP